MLMCPTAKCPTVGSRRNVVEDALLDALQQWLSEYKLDLSKATAENDSDSDSIRTAQSQISKTQKALDTMLQQKSNLYDFLEQGIYTQEIFLERSRILSARITDAENQISTLSEHIAALERRNTAHKELIPKIQGILDIYNTLDTPSEKNALLKTVLNHVVYSKSIGGRWGESDLDLYIYPKLPHTATEREPAKFSKGSSSQLSNHNLWKLPPRERTQILYRNHQTYVKDTCRLTGVFN